MLYVPSVLNCHNRVLLSTLEGSKEQVMTTMSIVSNVERSIKTPQAKPKQVGYNCSMFYKSLIVDLRHCVWKFMKAVVVRIRMVSIDSYICMLNHQE